MKPEQLKQAAIDYYRNEAANAYKMALRLSVLPEDRNEFTAWTTYANECYALASAISGMTRAEFVSWCYRTFVEPVSVSIQLPLW